jgi:hypothetical protein
LLFWGAGKSPDADTVNHNSSNAQIGELIMDGLAGGVPMRFYLRKACVAMLATVVLSEDRGAIQLAISQVGTALTNHTMDPKRAGNYSVAYQPALH